MILPDFLIIGAMKCGTSTLQAQLAAQPGIFMTIPKEPNFFSDDDIYAKGLDWYSRLFDGAGPDDLKGEASTHYTKLPTYPKALPRLAAAVDAPKLIYIIRNPVSRALSHYIHEWTEARMGDDLVVAFKEHSELVEYGRYAMQIVRFFEQFGAENIFLSSLEQLESTPEKELLLIGKFLGLNSPAIWQDEIAAQNISSERMRRLPMHDLLVDNPVARILRQSFVPKLVRTKIRQSRMIKERPVLPSDLRTQLEDIFSKDRTSLANYFPNHPALSLCYPFATV